MFSYLSNFFKKYAILLNIYHWLVSFACRMPYETANTKLQVGLVEQLIEYGTKGVNA